MQSEAEEERRSARQKQTASRESDKQKRLQAADKEVADVRSPLWRISFPYHIEAQRIRIVVGFSIERGLAA